MVEQAKEELVEFHQALVRIPTVNTGAADSGNEIAACRLLEERLAREGISSLILESAPTRGNLVASYGDPVGPRLLLMSHLDVVPVEDEHLWQRPPFSGDIVDGKVFGRGSDDAKSLASTGAMALILLKRAGIRLHGEVRFLAAADEEAGGNYGIVWLAKNHPQEIKSEWAINEGGGKPMHTIHGLAYTIAIGEKGRFEARFDLAGRSGHAARPWAAQNVLDKVAELLVRLQNYQPEIDLRLPFFDHLHLFGVESRPTVENLEATLESLKRDHQDAASLGRALSRMTLTPTMVSSGIKSNSVPASAMVVADIRTLPHQDEAYVRRQVEQVITGMDGVKLTLTATATSNASPDDSPFVAKLQQATEMALGRGKVGWIPAVTIGFTDSRWVRPLGTEVYGFSPLDPEAEPVRSGVHGVDEAMEIETLILRTKLNVLLAYLVLGEEPAD
jgi:acetylornithine deacetylase/succinyl-diaminopimelate desuccinylase-like protein